MSGTFVEVDGEELVIFEIKKNWQIFNDKAAKEANLWPMGYAWNRITEWCMENCSEYWWTDGRGTIAFSRRRDAMLFKLRFV